MDHQTADSRVKRELSGLEREGCLMISLFSPLEASLSLSWTLERGGRDAKGSATRLDFFEGGSSSLLMTHSASGVLG